MFYEFLSTDVIQVSGAEDADAASRRHEARQRVLLRADLYAVSNQNTVTVTDLSRRGLSGTTDIELEVGQTVFVSLDEFTHCFGTIRWINQKRFGVKFSNPLEALPESSQTDTGYMPDHQERMLRVAASFQATISLCEPPCAARVRNVSKSGMMIETDLQLSTDQCLIVSLSDRKILPANVRWVEGERVGVKLANPVSILQLTYGDFS